MILVRILSPSEKKHWDALDYLILLQPYVCSLDQLDSNE